MPTPLPPALPPPAASPLYGVVRALDGDVVIDTADAALARLVELLTRRPHLLGTLADASNPDSSHRRAAVAELREDLDVHASCVVRLGVPDAVQLAAQIITAASPDNPNGAGRVGGGADRSASRANPRNPRKDRP